MMEKIRLIGKEEGGYFTREDVVTALEVLHRERAISFGVREGFAMQHQLERIATALERIAESYVEGVVLSTDPEYYAEQAIRPCTGAVPGAARVNSSALWGAGDETVECPVKTKLGWDESGLDLDVYMPEPCEIDEALFWYICEVVPARYRDSSLCQGGDPLTSSPSFREDEEEVYRLMTVSEVGEKYFYLGVLPDFRI